MPYASVDTAASGDNTIVAADGDKQITVTGYMLVAAGAVLVRWKSGANNKSGAMSLAANGSLRDQNDAGVIQTNQSEALVLNLSGAVQVSGYIAYKKG